MTNAYGITLDSASLRQAAIEAVPETVIAALCLLPERTVDEIVGKLTFRELKQVIKLVGRCPSCYRSGTLAALRDRRGPLSPEMPAPSQDRCAHQRWH